MRRSIAVLLCLSIATPGVAEPSVNPPQASLPRAGDTRRLAELRPGARLLIASTPSPSTAGLQDRCRLISLDADALTCTSDDRQRIRMVFPIGTVDSVYHVHPRLPFFTIFGIAGAGVLIGGLIALSGGAVGIGLTMSAIFLGGESSFPAPAPPPAERFTLIYHR